MLQKISKSWGDFCIVAASGPSLSEEVARQCRGFHCIAVNDAHRLLPFSDMLYGCDGDWWSYYLGVPEFTGEKWSSHGHPKHNNKIEIAAKYRLRLVRGKDESGFSYDPAVIHYGGNSGFQAVNIAGHKIGWRGTIALVGFDMRMVKDRRHFFGDHPDELTNTTIGYSEWPDQFAEAAKTLPKDCRIINCTPDSALTCFPFVSLTDTIGTARAA